jgi:hypothetical protein
LVFIISFSALNSQQRRFPFQRDRYLAKSPREGKDKMEQNGKSIREAADR